MRGFVVVVVVAGLMGCPPPPAQPSYYTQPPPGGQGQGQGQAGYAPPSAASCQDTVTCYSQCTPFTEQCVQACEQRAAPQDAQSAHAVLACMGSSGCQDEGCVQQRCGAQLSTCSTALAQGQPQQPQQPAVQQPPPRQPPAASGTFDLAYQVPAGWSESRSKDTITLSYDKDDFYSPQHYKLNIFQTERRDGTSIADLFHQLWNQIVPPAFDTTQTVAPYRRRLASGYALAMDAANGIKIKANNGYTNVALYIIYTDDRYVLLLGIGLDVAAEPLLAKLFDGLTIRGAPPSRAALFDTSELVGHWSTSSTTVGSYVTSSGDYAGDASIGTGESINLESNGTYSKFFVAVRGSGGNFREKSTGRWKIEDDTLVLASSNGGVDKRRIWAFGSPPRGGNNALDLTNYGEALPRFFSPNDSINTSWFGRKN
jgi:hypothetical protein